MLCNNEEETNNETENSTENQPEINSTSDFETGSITVSKDGHFILSL